MTAAHETPVGDRAAADELMALYGEWKRLEQIAIFNGDEDAPWQAAFDAEDRFYEMPVCSPADVLFKLRVACVDGLIDSEGAKYLHAIMRDLEGMAGNVAVSHPV